MSSAFLSPAQDAIVRRLAAGETVPEIARALFMATATVYRHLFDARTRLGARTTAQLVARWAEAETRRAEYDVAVKA